MVNQLKQQISTNILLDKINAVNKANKNVIVSHVQPIDETDSLTFYLNGEKVGLGRRSYWSDGNDTEIVAVGSESEWTDIRKEDFNQLKKEWERLTQGENEKETFPSGTGPLLMGGISFDPLKSSLGEWSSFSSGAFTVPRYLLTKKKDKHWLTININVESDIDINSLVASLNHDTEILLRDAQDKGHILIEDGTDTFKTSSIRIKDWSKIVNEAVGRIKKGTIEKIVLSRTLHAENNQSFSLRTVLQRLRAEQAKACVFAIERDGDVFVGATPERLIKRQDGVFYTDCLAGTAPRGKTLEEDRANGDELLQDKKNVREHRFVVNMIEEVMQEFCVTAQVPVAPILYKTRDVQHLYTPISGVSKPGVSLLEVIHQLHPTPAMGGTPRSDALNFIRELEPHNRGWYSAPIGWLDANGDGEFVVAIRSALLKDEHAYLYAGCGIVRDSDPKVEYEETALKFKPMLSALGGDGR